MPAKTHFRGRVMDAATGEGLGGVLVRTESESAVTDSNGQYSLNRISPGYEKIEYVSEGYKLTSQELRVDSGATVSLDDIALEKYETGRLEGTVTDQVTGEPVFLASLRLNSHNSGYEKNEYLFTDSTGYFVYPALPAGTYEITVEKSGYRSFNAERVEVEGSQITGLEIELIPEVTILWDVNGDGNIKVDDAILVLRYVVGLVESVTFTQTIWYLSYFVIYFVLAYLYVFM